MARSNKKEEIFTLKELIDFAHKYLPRNYAPPDGFVLRKARGCWVWDTQGKKYLDMLGCYSAVNVGNGNKCVLEAVKKQLERGFTANANCFWEENKILFAKELAEFCEMDMALPMNSGAEAVETAMKIALKWGYTVRGISEDKGELIFCEGNFHGRTKGVISASTVPQYKDLFGPHLPGIKIVPFGDADELNRKINKNTAAFVFEPIQGEGGVIIPPDGYLSEVRKICNRNKILMVLDEIQSGFGRSGKMFAYEHEKNAKPDLMILGKALGGGLVVSAVVGKKDVMNVLKPGDHGSTFGGNPLACAAARASLRFIKEKKLPERAERLGKYFMDRLKEIAATTGKIKEIRGRGLWVGVEVNHDGPTAHQYCEAFWKEGILCKETREYTIRFSPPLIITKEELDYALRKIARVFVS